MIQITAKKDFIKMCRLKKGLSLNDIAKQTNLHYTTLYKIENITKSTSPKVAKKICEFFQMEFDELFCISNNKKEEDLQHGV
jgi:DNA-binding XRE family transcriptional regulator